MCVRTYWGAVGKKGHLSVLLIVTSNSSLSFEAIKLKYCIRNPHINVKKLPSGFLKFGLGAKI